MNAAQKQGVRILKQDRRASQLARTFIQRLSDRNRTDTSMISRIVYHIIMQADYHMIYGLGKITEAREASKYWKGLCEHQITKGPAGESTKWNDEKWGES